MIFNSYIRTFIYFFLIFSGLKPNFTHISISQFVKFGLSNADWITWKTRKLQRLFCKKSKKVPPNRKCSAIVTVRGINRLISHTGDRVRAVSVTFCLPNRPARVSARWPSQRIPRFGQFLPENWFRSHARVSADLCAFGLRLESRGAYRQ